MFSRDLTAVHLKMSSKRNLKHALKSAGHFEITSAQSTIYVKPLDDDADLEKACEIVSRVFGIIAFSRAAVCEKTIESVLETAPKYLENQLKNIKTFKVEAKRSDKKFSLKSPEICREVGGEILSKFPHLKVDVHNPDLVVNVEIRDFGAYVHGEPVRGAGGIPVGTGGRAAILISGGLDSPVAAYMMAKRGIRLTAIHFASPPYTSPRAEDKVVRLLRRVSRYAGDMVMYTVPFTKLQEKNQRMNVPKNFHNHYAPPDDADFRKDCRKVRMSGTHHRRKSRSGCKPDNRCAFVYR